MRKAKIEYRINIDFINFISKLIDEKTEIKKTNRETLKKEYEKAVKLRFNNLKRVARRNQRVEVKEILVEVLKNKKIEVKDYIDLSKKMESIVNKRSSNYAVIKI